MGVIQEKNTLADVICQHKSLIESSLEIRM